MSFWDRSLHGSDGAKGEKACCNATLLLEESAQVRVGQASNADFIF